MKKEGNGMPVANAVGADWTAILREATSEVFAMMLGCDIVAEPVPDTDPHAELPLHAREMRPALIEVLFEREHQSDTQNKVEVTAVVGIAGELCGVFNFCCGPQAARSMAARMLGVTEAEAGDQQWDAIGEICNMVAGNFKSKLPGIGERCMLSVPTIVVGSNYRLRTLSHRRKLECVFRVNGAPAHITLELQT